MNAGAQGDWLFDLGNSRLKFAPVVDGRVGAVQVAAHDGARFGEAWADALPPRFEAAWIASVAADALRVALLDALIARAGRLHLARSLAAFAGVRIAYPRPQRLGVDRFLALLGARAATGSASLVAGVGTALTVDLLDAHGRHHGGRIAPSPTLMREALHARAAQLPATGGRYREFADDTGDALASGCEGAALGLLQGSLAAATTLLGTPPALLVHGGGAEALLPHLPGAVHVPGLVLEGLLQFRIAACSSAR